MMKPASCAAADDLGRHAGGEVEADEQALAADLCHAGVGGQAVAQLLTQDGGVLEQVLVPDRPHDREGRRAGDRVAAEGRAVVAGLEQLPAAPIPMQAPIGNPPPSPWRRSRRRA